MFQQVVFLIHFSSVFSQTSENPASSRLKDTDDSWNYLGVTGYAGLITMNPLTGSSLFYWLFESIDSNITTDSRPLIIWLEGGPGCTGTFNMIWEGISPILVNNNTQPFRTNTNYTWSTSYHLMSVDFPYGTGYSFANSATDEKNTTIESTYYLYKLLYKLGQKYPSWFNRDIYILGHSVAGHWVTGLGWNVLQQNGKNTGFNINLKGIGVGGASIDPYNQCQTYASYAVANSLVNADQGKIMKYYQDLMRTQINQGLLEQASYNFDNIVQAFAQFSDGVNTENVRIYTDYDESFFDNWITSTAIREMLHVGRTSWVGCNDSIPEYFAGDGANSTAPLLEYILNSGVKVLLYSGQDDFIGNSPSVATMISALNWSGVSSFESAQKKVWMIDQKVAGYVQSNQNLTFALVIKAGHLTSYDQPAAVKNLVERFINGTGWD
jgi:carboxypeptidase C (cathepsin A)